MKGKNRDPGSDLRQEREKKDEHSICNGKHIVDILRQVHTYTEQHSSSHTYMYKVTRYTIGRWFQIYLLSQEQGQR